MLSKASQKKIVNAIFREGSGLVYSKDETEFDEKRVKFENDFHKIYQRSPYLQAFLDRIETNVCHPVWCNANLSSAHKNNDNEAINNVLKMKTMWKSLKVPQLIEVFIRIFKQQEKLVQCALGRFGKLSVKPWMYRKHTMENENWRKLTPEEQEKRLREFFKGPPVKPAKITSKNGKVTMNNVAKTARKKGAKKTHTKTTTVKKMIRKDQTLKAAAAKAKLNPPMPKPKRQPKKKIDFSDSGDDFEPDTKAKPPVPKAKSSPKSFLLMDEIFWYIYNTKLTVGTLFTFCPFSLFVLWALF